MRGKPYRTDEESRLLMKNMGLKAYVWRSCQDQKVRPSHANMEGVIVFLHDPPSPEKLIGEESIGSYHAGECEGCRCYAEGIVDVNLFIKWPCRIYFNGKIDVMTKEQFQALSEYF